MNNNEQLTPDKVRKYYHDHQSALHPYTWFHFMTRAYLLTGDQKAKDSLEDVHKHSLAGRTDEQQWQVLEQYLKNPKIPTNFKRVELLATYPFLRPAARAYFIEIFAQRLWQIDLGKLLKQNVPQKDVEENVLLLQHDRPGVLTLSTYAINFLMLAGNDQSPQSLQRQREFLFSVLSDTWQSWQSQEDFSYSLQNIIYFITHMIIGETLFYTREMPEDAIPLYEEALRKAEAHLQTDLTQVSLDCLCEFVVAWQLLKKESQLKPQIYEYVRRWKNNNGDYLSEPNGLDSTLDESEHLNVLFVSGF